MIKSFFAGRMTPLSTYLIGVVIIGRVNRFLWNALYGASLKLYVTLDEAIVDAMVNGVLFLVLAWQVTMLIVFWKSMWFERKPSAINWIGLLMIASGICLTSYTTLRTVTNFGSFSLGEITTEVADINRSLPVEVNEGVVLNKVRVTTDSYRLDLAARADGAATGAATEGAYDIQEGMIFRYFYTSRYDLAAGVNLLHEFDGMETCEMFVQYFRGPIDRIEFVYSTPSGELTDYLNGKACLEALALEK